MDRQKYPQIAASASFLLADIYIPDTLNPQKPEFEPQSEKLDLNAKQNPPENEPKKKASKKRRAKNKNRSEQTKAPDTNPNGESVTVDELRNYELPSFDPQVIYFRTQYENLRIFLPFRFCVVKSMVCGFVERKQCGKMKNTLDFSRIFRQIILYFIVGFTEFLVNSPESVEKSSKT